MMQLDKQDKEKTGRLNKSGTQTFFQNTHDTMVNNLSPTAAH